MVGVVYGVNTVVFFLLLLHVEHNSGQLDDPDSYGRRRHGDAYDGLWPSGREDFGDDHGIIHGDGTRKDVKISEDYTVLRPSKNSKKCERITVPLCQDIVYNKTQFPNILGHLSQDEAGESIMEFNPLVKISCSPDLKFFLCSVYLPFCSGMPTPIWPCQELCLSAKKGCENLMNKFGYEWPKALKCSKFPTKQPCVVFNKTKDAPGGPRSHGRPGSLDPSIFDGTDDTKISDMNIISSDGNNFDPGRSSDAGSQSSLRNLLLAVDQHLANNRHAYSPPSPPPRSTGTLTCFARYYVKQSYYYFGAGNETVHNCGLPCRQMFFTHWERWFLRIYILVFAVVCAGATGLTVLTFLIDRSRFVYPERPIIYLSLCFFVISVCYIVGYGLHELVTCSSDSVEMVKFAKNDLYNRGVTDSSIHDDVLILVKQRRGIHPLVSMGLELEGCAILAFIYYFFTLAAAAWWVILTFTWFLAAGLKWSHEAIDAASRYFHFVVWFFAGIVATVALATKSVDGDPLSGICGVGNWHPTKLIGYMVVPLGICHALGILFFILGICALYKIRVIIKNNDATKIERLTKLMVKISIFSVFYIIPAFLTLGIYWYEAAHMDGWLLSWYDRACKAESQTGNSLGVICPSHRRTPFTPSRPEFAVYVIKYLMILVVGISTSFWIWSPKTCTSWRGLRDKLCWNILPGGSPPPPMQHGVDPQGDMMGHGQPMHALGAPHQYPRPMYPEGGIHHPPGTDQQSQHFYHHVQCPQEPLLAPSGGLHSTPMVAPPTSICSTAVKPMTGGGYMLSSQQGGTNSRTPVNLDRYHMAQTVPLRPQ